MNDLARSGSNRSCRPSQEPVPVAVTYRRLLGYLKPHKGMFILGILGGTVYSASTASFAWLAKWFGDELYHPKSFHPDPHWVYLIPIALILIFLCRGIGNFTQTYCMGYVGRSIVKRLRGEVFRSVLDLPVAVFDRSSSGTLLSKLTYNSEQVGQASSDSIVIMVRAALTVVGMIVALFWLNWRLALISLAIGPLAAWLVSIVNKNFRRYGRRIQDSMGDVTRIAKESFEAPRLVKVYEAQPHLRATFDAVNEHNRRSYMRLILTRGLANPIVQLVSALGGALVLGLAIRDTVNGQMTPGDLFGFFTALTSIAQPLRELVSVADPLQQGITAAESLFELIDEPPEPAGGTYVTGRATGQVSFRDATFSYPRGERPALHAVSLEVPAGSSLAIVGRSGSGKSTLVSLLPRFYDLTSGSVLIDGRDIREYDLRSLRAQIAVVSQDVTLFNDTIRNNIAFGRKVSDSGMQRAAEAAYVLEFTSALPDGLDTMVGDRGVLLSGGQRQRISIARALLKNAPILILDEATSALDTESERHIQAALAHLVRNRTTFVIAHRLSTVEQADRIVVLDAGQVVESGTHAELLALGGRYAQLYKLQFAD
ncbi:MAG TPA: lipid A export permease/ATP-binding protein MsbA [Steroidobacteraceae bacterium]|nr:lipid A export permease/ATP-binding protein MsbA [Steroidobacteraceae bacterium]